jgi:glutaredoxin-related protein
MVSFLFVNSIISVANVYIKEVVRNRDQTKELNSGKEHNFTTIGIVMLSLLSPGMSRTEEE